MIAETLKNIVEIEGLKRKVEEFKSGISAEMKRITDLEKIRESKKNNIVELENKIHDLKLKELELDLLNLENRIEKLTSQNSMVQTEKEAKILENEISLHTKEHQIKEKNYFEFLDLESKYQEEILDIKNFLNGSQLTLNDIKKEAEEKNAKSNIEINNLNNRINSLIEQMPISQSKLYLETCTRLKASISIAHINGKNCNVCKIAIDQLTITNVENHASLEMCPNCGRILIPHNLY